MDALVYDVGPARWMLCKAAGRVSPRVYWSRWSGLRMARVAVPALPNGQWVRLRPILGGICGTDLAAIQQRNHPASVLQVFSSFPAMLGHENLSIVEQVGPEVAQWKPGDRVVVEPTLSCVPRGIDPPCANCTAGRFTLCQNFRQGPLPVGSMIGWNAFTGGTWGPNFVAHASQLHAVPAEMPDEDAVLVDPIAGALHAVMRRPPQDGEQVLVLGGGLVGVGVVASIRALGFRGGVEAVVRHERQAELMRRFGADEIIRVGRGDDQATRYGKVAARVGGVVVPSRFGHQALTGGFDLVYECVGTGQAVTDAMKYTQAGGMMVMAGTTQITLTDLAPLWLDELEVVGANGRAVESFEGRLLHTYEVVFELVRRGALDLSGLLTHRFPPRRYAEAFDTLVRRGQTGAIKVAFEPQAGL
jgi:threonine dehydrogenase-like Zn-dependent dehydrogenase